MEYYLFYDNMGAHKIVPVAFGSEKSANDFIEKYENYGGYKQFRYDHYGKNKEKFIQWLEEHHPIKDYPEAKRRNQIVKSKGFELYKYMMSIFGVKI